MSLADITSRCFQNGVPVQKWAGMCLLKRDKDPGVVLNFESIVCNSILILFSAYPADVTLRSYIKYALNSHLFPLYILVKTFLEVAKSPALHDASTIDMICQLIQTEHFSTGLPPMGSLIDVDEPAPTVVEIVHCSFILLRMSYNLPPSPFHNVTGSVSELVSLLYNCIGDMSQVSTRQAMLYYGEVMDILQTVNVRLSNDIQRILETYTLQLSMVLGDDAKMAQEAQMMQTLQLSLGKGDILGPNSQSDLVTCSLLLRYLVANRAGFYGSGNISMAVASLVATFRWTSWSPKTFYNQLFLAATAILAQASSHHNTGFLWRSFIITRLTALLPHFERIISSEPLADSDWRGATKSALGIIQNRADFLVQCDTVAAQKDVDDISMDHSDNGLRNTASGPPPYIRTLMQYCLHRANLIDKASAMQLDPSLDSTFNTQLDMDSMDSGLSLDAYINSRLIADANNDENLLVFLQRVIDDIPNHPFLSSVLKKRFVDLCQLHDVEGLGNLCKVLNLHDLALDIISLHIKITDILAHIMAFVDDFDCESVGDPQSAVGHLGSVVLFLQSTLVKYQLFNTPIVLGERVLKTDYLLSTSTVFRRYQLSNEDLVAMGAWFKALFDTSSEGIEDNILRTTKHKTLLKLSASLILNAANVCAERKMEIDTLNNGVSYFTGPLLNWTLVGVIKSLLRDILAKDFNAPVHLEVLQTLVQSPSCPRSVLCLTAHGILALLAEPKAQTFERTNQNSSFDSAALRAIANRALGVVGEDPSENGSKALTMGTQALWLDQPRHAIRDAIAAARSGKAPSLDVARSVAVIGPTKFVSMLWDEISAISHMGDVGNMEIGRRLATHALLCPPSGHVPPLLPIFFGSLMHALLARIDRQIPTEQMNNIELLVAVITSSLTGVLQVEWALRAVDAQGEARHPIGQPSVTIARRLAADLKRSKSSTAALVMQRLSSSPSFVANFPMMVS